MSNQKANKRKVKKKVSKLPLANDLSPLDIMFLKEFGIKKKFILK